jgi:hypothetical protein
MEAAGIEPASEALRSAQRTEAPGHRLVLMDSLRERVPYGDSALRLRSEESFSLS